MSRDSTRLRRWIVEQSARNEQRPLLEDSLLIGNLSRYARYRLRVFFVAQLIAFGVYLAEYTFLSSIFFQRHLVTALWLLNASAIVTGCWWGALEVARSRIRDAARPHDAGKHVTPWVHAALLFGVVPFGVEVALVVRRVFLEGGVFNVFDLWTLACLLRLWVDLVAQAFYAGAYAIQRIYRPLWVPPVLRAASFSVIVLAWPLLGPWSFSLGFLIAGLVSSGVAIRYSIRAYRQRRIDPPRLGAPWRFGWPSWTTLRTGSAAGLASISMRLSTTLVLVFFVLYGHAGGLPLAFVFHLMSPLLAATGSWAQTFYFDWKRLDRVMLATFRARFDAFMPRLALGSGLACWVIAMPVLCVFARTHGLVLGLLSLPMFVVRARIAVLQVKYFAEKRYGWLTGSTSATVALLAILLWPWRDSHPDFAGLEALLLLTGLLSVQLAVLLLLDRPAPPERGHALSLAEWAAALSRCRGPVTLGAGELATRLPNGASRVLAALAPRIGVNVSLASGRRFVWYGPPSTLQEAELRDAILVDAAGMVERVQVLPAIAHATDALRAALAGALAELDATDSDDILARFTERFPEGLLIDVRAGRVPPTLRGMMLAERREIWNEAKLFVHGVPRARSRSSYDVSTYAPCGRIDVIFLVDRSAPPEERRRWRQFVAAASWGATLREAGV